MNLLDLIFPKVCCGCGKLGSYLCASCKKEIFQEDLVCPLCERPSIGGITHPLCKRKHSLDGLWSLGIYKGPLKKVIQKLKYKFVKDAASELIDLTIEYWIKYQPYILEKIKDDRGKGWVVTCVPLHKRRESWRGFNQSELLGNSLAKKLGLQYENLLIRTKNTKSQVGLMGRQRKTNIRNAFSLNTKYELANTHIILIDDVWTTGSTLKECSFVLKRFGAKEVWGLTIAR